MLILKSSLAQQPQSRLPLNGRFPRPKILIVPSIGLVDLMGNSTVTPGANFAGVETTQGGVALNHPASETTTNYHLSFPLWPDSSKEASVLLVQRKVNQDSTLDRWLELGTSGSADHFPYGNGAYTDAFWNARWASNISTAALPLTKLHTVILSVRNGLQTIHVDGKLFHENTLTGGFAVPATGNIHGASGLAGYYAWTYMAVLWDKFIDKAQAAELGRNPWQIFRRRILIPVSVSSQSHSSAGDLAAQDATLAGTATHLTLHTSTGALSAQAATVSGAAVHPHIATGALEAQAATVDGTASLTVPGGSHASDGAIAAAAAEVAGTAAHYTLHASSGALEAQAAAVAGTATHLTLHTATGDLVAGSASVSGAAVDETTYVPPAPNKGGGRSKRKRRYQVEVNGEVHEVASAEEAEEILEQVAKKAEETAKQAIERASRAKRRPARKVIADARKTLEVPEISVPADFRDIANQIIGRIKADYQSALSSIEISAHLARREREIEEDDEDILMLL